MGEIADKCVKQIDNNDLKNKAWQCAYDAVMNTNYTSKMTKILSLSSKVSMGLKSIYQAGRANAKIARYGAKEGAKKMIGFGAKSTTSAKAAGKVASKSAGIVLAAAGIGLDIWHIVNEAKRANTLGSMLQIIDMCLPFFLDEKLFD